MNRSALMVVCIFQCCFIVAQNTAQFKGEVTNKETQLPIPNVIVLIDSIQTGEITDSSGKFHLKDVIPGYYNVTFRANGYKDLIVYLVGFRADQITVYLAEMVPLTMYDFPKEFWRKKKKKK
jgi:hypothetical protein